MTKDFCDRCGELIQDGKYATGETVIFCEGDNEKKVWQVEIKIKLNTTKWLACPYCCDEIVDEAYKRIIQKRAKREEQPLKPDWKP